MRRSKIPLTLLRTLKRTVVRRYVSLRHGLNRSAEYSLALPDGYGHRQAVIKISVPNLPAHGHFSFSEHVMDSVGNPTRTVIATTTGGFAVSPDLGQHWRSIRVRGYEGYDFTHVHYLNNSEYLALAEPAHLERDRRILVDVLVVDEDGRVLEKHPAQGSRWHSCRAVDMAGGTLMYAEYPADGGGIPSASRVFRSRDRGRSWEVVFQQSAEQIRHFHFLQPRLDSPGEWWLTSGDAPGQSKIWVTKDDGNTWRDITADSPLTIDGTRYPRSIFRLTDLVWTGPEVIWGADDSLRSLRKHAGARVFRSQLGPTLVPRPVGRTRWPIRNIVDLGEFLIVLSQASNRPETSPAESRPSVLLMPKREIEAAPKLFHLFEIENFATKPLAGSGFTYSRASRRALDDTFFTYRAPYQALPSPQQILKWEISFA